VNESTVELTRPRTVTRPRPERPLAAVQPTPIPALDIEAIRVVHEHAFAEVVGRHPRFAAIVASLRTLDPKDERRRLMAESLRLSEAMAPQAHQLAKEAQRVLGVEGELELYQRRGPENAAMHFVEAPILLEIHGSLLPRLDPGSLTALLGHELGHYLAHGPKSPHPEANRIPCGLVDDRLLDAALSRLSMSCELTADRVALLACQDLDALLRLMLVTVSGLAVGELAYDTEAYLAQCKELIEEDLRTGAVAQHGSHPEHSLRAYAAWLFSETGTYRALTGRGPGTRELAEVDAMIARCFGASSEVIHDVVQAGEVPRELLECALAAAVMVAHADGELSEEELLLLEHAFASEISDWQSYLELPRAVERFLETAAVLAPSAHEVGPALLNLLFEIALSDRELSSAELGMVLEIGRVLGVGPQFSRALAAMLRRKGISIDLATVAAPEQPLPARRQEVDDALQTFLAGVQRRGEGTVTLRRLLRLLGSEQRTDELLAKLDEAFTRHHIAVTPHLAEVSLDERLALLPSAPLPVKGAAAPPMSASRAALLEALRRLREQLVSGDGRSPSVRLRQVRRGRAFDLTALEKVSVGMAERVMAQLRARKPVRVIDAADAGRHGAASAVASELLALAREDTQRTEETGARDLYVGYPFLTGYVAGYLVRAPLVLYPVELVRDGDGARGFRLDPRRDEPPIANQSLIRLIFNKRGFAYSDELSDELEALAGDPDGGPEAVRRRLAEVGLVAIDGAAALQPLAAREELDEPAGEGVAIEEAAVLGLFPQSSSDLLQDYDGLLHDLAQPGADVSALLAAASALLPEHLAPPAGSKAAPLASDWVPVIPADPSQRSVIAEARRHGATVIDGPPGTGKSQVIVNLVAEALRRGERVAVVCEKRAALDVVRQRMAAIGFGKALAVVHDVHEDRKPLFAHIAGRLEATGRIPFAAAEAERAREEHAAITAALQRRLALLNDRPEGLALTIGELLAFAAQRSTPPLSGVGGIDRVRQDELRLLQELAASLHPLRDLWAPQSRWHQLHSGRTRRSLASYGPTTSSDLAAALRDAARLARDVERLGAALPHRISLETLVRSRAALATAVASRHVRVSAQGRAAFSAIARQDHAKADRLSEAERTDQVWRECGPALLRVEHRVDLEPPAEMTAAVSILKHSGSAWSRFLRLAWWRARAQLRRGISKIWPARAGQPLTPELVAEVDAELTASRGWRAVELAFQRIGLRAALPRRASELPLLLAAIAESAHSVRALLAARHELDAAGAWLPEAEPLEEHLPSWERGLDERLAVLAAYDALRAALAPLRPWFPELPELPTAAALEELLVAWLRDDARVAEADALLIKAEQLLPGAHHLLLDPMSVDWAELPTSSWRDGLAGEWAAAKLARLERQHPELAALGKAQDDHEIERLVARLRELEVERRELEIERTLARLDDTKLLNVEAAAKHQRRTAEQKAREELLKEARKQRMLMPLRTFVRRFAPAGLLDVTPVWLLSPETMAILFPRQALFDLVVFDEASQCTVEAGLPVLLRARRVAIAGDEKQMPPSSYFAMGGGEEEDARAGGETADERRDTLRDLLTAESLLSLARPRVAHAGLAWHYRCRDESLIAFSNHAMYQGELLTVPSTAAAATSSALHWVTVEHGAYHGGENVVEARRVVDVVAELLARTPRPTFGVVTFNLRQRKAVLDAIDARCASDDGFCQRWAEAAAAALDERPFVRNLEQVQGDERDVIVFSLGHAPQARQRGGVATGETYVPARFGPLGQRGGERRLNVAISRAKAACYLVASFDPAQLTVASAKHQGPRLFKHFLEFASHHHHGRHLEAARVLELVRGGAGAQDSRRHRAPIEGYVPLQTQLALALEAAGIPHELDVGASGFRIPVAIRDPADPARFALAVLLQEGTGPADPFELHVHRPEVLRQRGWSSLTISAASWYRRSAELLDELAAAVPGCRGAVTSEAYLRYRAAQAQRAGASMAPARLAAGTRAPGGTTSSSEPAAPSETATAPVAAIPVGTDRRDSAPQPALPAWALAISDELFRTALLHLERHGLLTEAELSSLVGGPRRARAFARELDDWRAQLPFVVELSVIDGAKAYRRGGAN
jgi:AAA domain/Protein of unknown function (DUF4011)